MNFAAYPLVRVGVFFIFGIISQKFLNISGVVGLSVSVMLLLIIWYILPDLRFSLRYFESWLIISATFFTGFFITEMKNKHMRNAELPAGFVELSGVVKNKAVAAKGKSKLILEYFSEGLTKHPLYNTKQILIYFDKTDTSVFRYQVRDQIQVSGTVREVKSSSNPGSFDKKTFYFHKGITQEMYADSFSHKLIRTRDKSFFYDFTDAVKENWLKKIDIWIEGKEERAIIKALLLGYKDEIDKNLYQSFSQTGAIHVLAVSGLHVGAVLYLFMFMFRFLPKKPWIKWIVKPGILIILATVYVVLTGASPSVIRASVMFILLLIGREWFKSTHIMNIFFATAMWMLMYDPFLIYNLSFQFSYLSLAGIILFYPHVKLLYIPSNKIESYLWDLTAVSIAAQFFVFPLALYYFHQFPVYFILSNIFAIPATLLLVNGGIVLFVISFVVDLKGSLVVSMYHHTTTFLRKSVQFVQELPYAVIEGVWIEPWQVLLLFLAVLLLLIYLENETAPFLYIFLGVLLIFILSFEINVFKRSKNHKIYIYESNFGYLLDVKADRTVFVLKSLKMGEEQELFLAQNNRAINHATRKIDVSDHQIYTSQDIKISLPYIKSDQKEILLIGRDFPKTLVEKVDMLVVTRGNNISPYYILALSQPKMVVLAPDIEKYKIPSWESCLEEMEIPYWNIRNQGFYSNDL